MANLLLDARERLEEAFASCRSEPIPEPARRTGAWPVEQADIFVLDPKEPVALCTLGDPHLARRLADAGHTGLALVGPLATENLGVEKLVRNVVGSPAIRTVVLVGPETGGTAPTGHYAGDALLCLVKDGVDATTKRIVGARGRRPFVKNLTLEEIESFRRRATVIDHRGLTDAAAIATALDAAAEGLTVLSDSDFAERRPTEPAACTNPSVDSAAVPRSPSFRRDPAGYFVIFCDHQAGRLVVEHYTNDDARTTVLAGTDPHAISGSVLAHGLLSTLDHAVYLARELERAATALEAGQVYIQDSTGE